MQKVILIGRLGSDPEIRSTPSGVTVCSFTLAVDGKKEGQTTWYKISAWRHLGESCGRYLSRGKKCAVIGELQPREYTAKDGTTRMSLDVQADEVEFIDRKDKTEKPDQVSEIDTNSFSEISSDMIPF